MMPRNKKIARQLDAMLKGRVLTFPEKCLYGFFLTLQFKWIRIFP